MPKTANVNEQSRAIKALNLRAQGATYDQIAERLGYSNRGGAHKAVARLLRGREAEGVDELRAQGQARYETVIREMGLLLSERKQVTEVTDTGVETKVVPVHDSASRTAAARAIIRAQDSLNRLFGLNMEQPSSVSNHQVLIVEAEVLSNNMAQNLLDQPQLIELGEIVDVVVDDD